MLLYKSEQCPGMLNSLIASNQVQLHVLKVFNHSRFSSSSFIKQALEYCLRMRISIIALPLGTEMFLSKDVKQLFAKIVRNNGVIISAAGNSGPGLGTLTYPGDQDLVLSVGSYKYNDNGVFEVSSFSSKGPALSDLVQREFVKFKPDVLGYGEGIQGADIKAAKCVSKSGTSLSAIMGILCVYFCFCYLRGL
jgi:subtilisin family serine protease